MASTSQILIIDIFQCKKYFTLFLGPKQPKINQFFRSNCTQKQLDNAIVDHVIDDIGPFTLGEKESFQNIVKLLDPTKKTPDYRNMVKLLDDKYNGMKEKLLEELAKAVYVSVSTDAWKGNKKNYAGFTATWFDENLVRNFAVLAVRRMRGHHTFDVVRKEITEILKEFR